MFLSLAIKDSEVKPICIVDNQTAAVQTVRSYKWSQFHTFVFQGEYPKLKEFLQKLKNEAMFLNGLNEEQLTTRIKKDAVEGSLVLLMEDLAHSFSPIGEDKVVDKLVESGFDAKNALKIISSIVDHKKEFFKIDNLRIGYVEGVLGTYVVAAVKRYRKPGVETYPNFITDRGKKVWQYTFKNYKTDPLMVKLREKLLDPALATLALNNREEYCQKHNEIVQKMWYFFINRYTAICSENRVMPFDERSANSFNSDRSLAIKNLRSKVVEGNELADKAINEVENRLENNALIKSFGPETFYRVSKSNYGYTITSRRIVKLAEDIHYRDIIKFLGDKLAWSTKKGSLACYKQIDSLTIAYFGFDSDTNVFCVYTDACLTPSQANLLVEEHTLKDDDLLQKLKRISLDWFSTGRLKFA